MNMAKELQETITSVNIMTEPLRDAASKAAQVGEFAELADTVENIGRGVGVEFKNINPLGKLLPLCRVICLVPRVNS